MKKSNKILVLIFLIFGFVFTSCETTDLDILNDPNNITPENGELGRFTTSIQLDYASFIRQMGNNGAELTRINYMFGREYVVNFQPELMNGEWALAYQGMFSDMIEAQTLAEVDELTNTIGVMKIIKGHVLLTLVDYFGDIPFSEANKPGEFSAPKVDPGADVYQAALGLLSEGISLINEGGEDTMENDFIYGNDFSKWVKLANTVKMAAYLNLNDTGNFNAIANNPSSYISSTDDDCQFTYGTNESNPDTRHPSYADDYATSGAGTYRSNWLMDKMVNDNDPRRLYYFYRQNHCTPRSIGADGQECDGNQTVLGCSVGPRPFHFPSSMVFCSVDNGYWGRDHGNAEGIPPDSFSRTVVGVYPAAGKFDDNDPENLPFPAIGVGAGGAGAGIVPIMLASWADFMIAEVKLYSGDAGGAETKLSAALTKSVDKVMASISWDPTANTEYIPSSTEVTTFKNLILDNFNSASTNDKKNILARQFFVSQYGSGIGSYNMYRRTGYPHDVQFNIEENSGPFIRSFFYPANEANTNPNIVQKPNVAIQVFWDNNPASPGFPVAN